MGAVIKTKNNFLISKPCIIKGEELKDKITEEMINNGLSCFSEDDDVTREELIENIDKIVYCDVLLLDDNNKPLQPLRIMSVRSNRIVKFLHAEIHDLNNYEINISYYYYEEYKKRLLNEVENINRQFKRIDEELNILNSLNK